MKIRILFFNLLILSISFLLLYISSHVTIEKRILFTFNSFSKERELIKTYHQDEFKEIGAIDESGKIDIGIALEDINNDGKKEILGLLFHPLYVTSKVNSMMIAYFIDKDKIVYSIPISKVHIVPDEPDRLQQMIKVRKNKKTGWDDFLIDDSILEIEEHVIKEYLNYLSAQ